MQEMNCVMYKELLMGMWCVQLMKCGISCNWNLNLSTAGFLYMKIHIITMLGLVVGMSCVYNLVYDIFTTWDLALSST